jgi:hypothetical protein
MIDKLDTHHRYQRAARRCLEKVFVGVGGTGREAARTAYLQERQFFGRASPYSTVVEIDLCSETGRGIEPTFVPDDPGALMQLIFPGVDCRALVQRAGLDGDPMWAAIDPEQIKDIENTAKLGGFACPQAARAVQEMYRSVLDEFLRRVAQQAETMRRTTVPGWERTGGPLHVFVYASQNGAVGSTAMHVIDKLAPRLTAPVRVVFVPLLLADHGRVTDRRVASALQHAGLTEILQRARGRHE